MKTRLIIAVIITAVALTTFTSARTYRIPSQTDKNTEVEQIVKEQEKTIQHELSVSGVEDLICIECDKYGVDAELALAIAKLETGHFTSDAYIAGNNVGGLSVDEEPMAFASLERGVEAFVMNLHYNYYRQGLDTVEEIAPKYCPVNEEHWAESVKVLMQQGESDGL